MSEKKCLKLLQGSTVSHNQWEDLAHILLGLILEQIYNGFF